MRPKAATPIPEVEILARPTGKFSWVCPNCGQDQPFSHFPWRRCDGQCARCKTHYRFGAGFDLSPMYPAYLMGKYNGYTVNRWKPMGTFFDGGKLHGAIEWVCPHCQVSQKGFLAYDGRLPCEGCYKDFYISLLIYRATKTPKIIAPFDSIVKGITNGTKETPPIQSAPPTPSDSGDGAAG